MVAPFMGSGPRHMPGGGLLVRCILTDRQHQVTAASGPGGIPLAITPGVSFALRSATTPVPLDA
jgi:hypothetical protein